MKLKKTLIVYITLVTSWLNSGTILLEPSIDYWDFAFWIFIALNLSLIFLSSNVYLDNRAKAATVIIAALSIGLTIYKIIFIGAVPLYAIIRILLMLLFFMYAIIFWDSDKKEKNKRIQERIKNNKIF